MATQSTHMAGVAQAKAMDATSYDRFAGICAILAGVFGLLYSIAFVVIARNDSTSELGTMLYSISQLAGGILTTAALIAIYNHVREINPGFALWGLVLGLVGAAGSMIHGGYDLANATNPPDSNVLGAANLPNLVDPRGLLTFGVAGVGLFALVWLMSASPRFPKGLAYLGYALAVLLIVLYLGRLIVLDANSLLILIPAALAGFIVNPVWYVWLGMTLRREK